MFPGHRPKNKDHMDLKKPVCQAFINKHEASVYTNVIIFSIFNTSLEKETLSLLGGF